MDITLILMKCFILFQKDGLAAAAGEGGLAAAREGRSVRGRGAGDAKPRRISMYRDPNQSEIR